MGNFLVQQEKQFFPHDLGHHLALRLVGGHVVGEELGALGEVALQHVEQLLHPLARSGGDGHHRVEVIRAAVHLDDLQQLFLLLQGVRLVDSQHGRTAQGLDPGDQLPLRLPHMGDGLHQQQDAVHPGYALFHHVHHVVPQTGPGTVEAGGVHKDELALPPVFDAADAVPGGLGLVGNNGHFLPHKGVGQGGLAHVGPSADGNNT